MRIVQVSPFYHPVLGGMEKVVKKVAEYLRSEGHDLRVITYNRTRKEDEVLPKEEVVEGIPIRRIKPDFTWSHGSYSSDLPNTLKRLDPDIVHVHAWRHPHVYQIANLKNELGFKAVLHGHAPFHRFEQLRLITWLYHKMFDLAMSKCLKEYDRIIALTPHERNILIKRFSVSRGKVAVVPNGIDIDPPLDSVSDSEPFLFYLGRISKSKNINLLLEAVKLVNKKLEIGLRMAGPDEGIASNVNDYTKKQELDIQYLGVISKEEKLEMYKKCKLFVHPAVYEPFGITLLEAQAFGKPCVITGTGGQLYAAPPGKTSIRADPNPEDFAQAIISLLENEELYEKLSENARNWATKHAWSKILPKYDEIYTELDS